VFARATNITRQLRHRDVDVAMAPSRRASRHAHGWSLREFNWRWARRLGQNACLLTA
jgi:uncharacterized protein with von Willebrand factor type A (vWA) domain